MTKDYTLYALHDVVLQSGITLPKAHIAYKTYGALNADKSNVILYPTSYGAQHHDTEWLIGEGRVLDPTTHFIVIPNMFTNGLSTSPSNLEMPFGTRRYPLFTHWDNVHAQRHLLKDVFGIEKLALIYGWSMGAQQAFHWGAIFPDQVERICATCGTARTSPHNTLFLEGVAATLKGDPHWAGDHFTAHPDRGLRAMGRVYAGWAMSQTFYRERLYEKAGFSSQEDFIVRNWEGNFLRRDPHDLLANIDTWIASDISNNQIFEGDLDRALASIKARTIVMPSSTDLYFTPEDCRLTAARIPNAEYRILKSDWGHRAGNPVFQPDDEAQLRTAVRDLLDR